jgi:nicotinamidase-related amidase
MRRPRKAVTAKTEEKPMLMHRDRSHLLIVDVQEKLAPAVQNPEALTQRIRFLSSCATRLGVPITISEQYPRGLGPTIAPILEKTGNAAIRLDKTEFSCLRNPGLKHRFETLREQKRGQVVVCGMEAHVCVLQTALDLHGAGYDVFVPADAISSRAETSKEAALHRMRDLGCTVVDAEMVMFEWLGEANTEEFKELQRLIK